MKSISEIIKDYDEWSIPRESFNITREEWQTLRSAVLAAQTNNNARDEICAYHGKDCGYMRFNDSCMGKECSLHPSRKHSPVA